jgi:hypothetical protein
MRTRSNWSNIASSFPVRPTTTWTTFSSTPAKENLVIGTDYGHNDQSTEIEALRNLKSQGGITPRQYEKITYDNAKELFGL